MSPLSRGRSPTSAPPVPSCSRTGSPTSSRPRRSTPAGVIELGVPTIREAAARIRAGSLTSQDLLEATLERLAETEPLVHAYATVVAESAREAARAADEEIARSGPRGPLHGIPVAVKDLLVTRD